MNEKWPRPSITRGKRKRGVRYFGPYGNVKAIRETLDLLIKSFPLRTCSNVKFNEHEKTGKPCLLFHSYTLQDLSLLSLDHLFLENLTLLLKPLIVLFLPF